MNTYYALAILFGAFSYAVINKWLQRLIAKVQGRKYLVIVIRTRDGEHEHEQTCTLVSTSKDSAEEIADRYCATFWGKESIKQDVWYEFMGDTLMSKVSKVTEVTRQEYYLIEKVS